MDVQDQKLLEEVAKLSRENNAALRKLVSYHRSALVWRVIYWTIIIGATIAAYFSIQPYMASLVKLYSGGQDFVKLIDNFNAAKK